MLSPRFCAPSRCRDATYVPVFEHAIGHSRCLRAGSAGRAGLPAPLGVSRLAHVCRRAARLSVVAQDAAAAGVTWATYAAPTAQTLTLKVPNSADITLQTGEIGRQAAGAVVASMGETVVYCTACCSEEVAGDGSFLPLTVNYQERFSAAGRTPGSYFKRDARPRDADVLVSRLVDRPLRPLFRKGWANDTQVLQWVLSYDAVNLPEPLAITAAGAALLLSDIPFDKAVAGVRVGLLPGGGGLVINPTAAQLEASSLDLVMAGTKDAVLMIEGFADFLAEEQMLEALAAGHSAIRSMCEQVEAWARSDAVGKPKRAVPPAKNEELERQIRELVGEQLIQAYRTPTAKEALSAAVSAAKAAALAAFAPPAPAGSDAAAAAQEQQQQQQQYTPQQYTAQQVATAFKAVNSAAMRQLVLTEGIRADGRSVSQVRPIYSRADVLPRTHGSCLFTRGETQALCVATLGTKADAQRIDNLRTAAAPPSASGDEPVERFLLQYFFPPSSVGETGRVGGPGRRELGHGELAQRALTPIVPSQADFPYSVRLESTITESNGSSSMASVCGGCLAMLDAGVPLDRLVAGIAMGLILEPDTGRYQVLTDILGSEDALGDMDFKVAGDERGLTAFQMDIKVEGITLDIMRAALAQAGDGRRHILGQMALCSPPPRRQLSSYAPKMLFMQIPPDSIGAAIGSGGKNIKAVREQSGVSDISFQEGGAVEISGPSLEACRLAQELISAMVTDPAPGHVYRQRKVVSLLPFGALVEIAPGRSALLHVSEIDHVHVADVAAVLSIGQLLDVQVLEAADGKIKVSRKALLPKPEGRVGGSGRSSSSGSGGDDTNDLRDQRGRGGDGSDGDGGGSLMQSMRRGGEGGGGRGGGGRGGRGGGGRGGGGGGGRGRY